MDSKYENLNARWVELEAQVKEARRLEKVAIEREERAVVREQEGRRWEIAATAREERLMRNFERQTAISREAEERSALWERRAREADEGANVWERRAREAEERVNVSERRTREAEERVNEWRERSMVWERRVREVEEREVMMTQWAAKAYRRAERLEIMIRGNTTRIIAIEEGTLL